MYWNKELEVITREDLESLQLKKLKTTLKAALETKFYKSQFKEYGVNPEKLNSLDDLENLPFTTKDDLRRSYPDGMVAISKKEIVRLHASSGTTGKSTVIFYSQEDINSWADIVARGMYSTGVRKSDVFQNMMGYGLFTGGLGLHYGAEKIGCLVIPSATGNSLKQIELMEDFDSTVLHITPSYALHLKEIIENEGYDPKSLPIKKAILGAEPYTEATRDKIESQYGIDVYNGYGLSEMNGPGVAFECSAKQGMHIWEDFYIAEIINPDTGKVLPIGHYGELVLTHINRKAMPILRYRTRDLTRLIDEPCPCGRTHRKIERIKGRTDDMLIISGCNVFPSQIETVLMQIPEVGNNFQIVIDRESNLDRLHIRVELYSKMFHGNLQELERLKSHIIERMKSLIVVTPRIELLEPGSLPASTGKAKRVFDNRSI
jgi:phenylacetate-CoA ligase